jgi:hypothetical protein
MSSSPGHVLEVPEGWLTDESRVAARSCHFRLDDLVAGALHGKNVAMTWTGRHELQDAYTTTRGGNTMAIYRLR